MQKIGKHHRYPDHVGHECAVLWESLTGFSLARLGDNKTAGAMDAQDHEEVFLPHYLPIRESVPESGVVILMGERSPVPCRAA